MMQQSTCSSYIACLLLRIILIRWRRLPVFSNYPISGCRGFFYGAGGGVIPLLPGAVYLNHLAWEVWVWVKVEGNRLMAVLFVLLWV